MASSLNNDLATLFEKAFDENLENLDVKINDGKNTKGEGFLSEMTFASVKNKRTGEDYHLIVKVRPQIKAEFFQKMLSLSYLNEIHYYTKIFPALENFQKSFPEVNVFDHFPKCYITKSDLGSEKIVLENLENKYYKTHPKTIPLDLKTYEAIFKLYGEFHGAFMAFGNKQSEEFLELTKPLHNNWLNMNEDENEGMFDFIKRIFIKVKKLLENEGEEKIVEKLQKYIDNPSEIFVNSVTYRGSHPTLLHGDCWSNNMMFKYNSAGEVEDIKMIDFQIGYTGSPVEDLSYSLYSGADKGVLDNLENLLKIYHDSLSKNLRLYGCDPMSVYPYEMLKKEWKEYCQFGFLMGCLVWSTKHVLSPGDLPSIDEQIEHNKTDKKAAEEAFFERLNKEKFYEMSVSLVNHMAENDFLL